jgi:ABC-type antimicrobial peptide transport system permease subunit
MISYVVASRTTEIGVRLAIGAQPGHVRRQVMGDALRTVVPGVVVGMIGALAVERVIASFLFGATARDPRVYGAVIASLLLTAVAAAYWPARRASRIDPVNALRCD